MAKVLEVERKNKKAERVVIEAGMFRISFALIDGKVKELSRVRLDGARLNYKESLRIAPSNYQKIRSQAAAILTEERAQR